MDEMREDRFTQKAGELPLIRADQGVLEGLAKAKRLAQEYRHLTEKPLGITREVAAGL